MTTQTHEMLLSITLVLTIVCVVLMLRFAHLKTRFQNWLARQVPDDPASRLYGPSIEWITNPEGVLNKERLYWRDRKLTRIFCMTSTMLLLITIALWITR